MKKSELDTVIKRVVSKVKDGALGMHMHVERMAVGRMIKWLHLSKGREYVETETVCRMEGQNEEDIVKRDVFWRNYRKV